MNMCGDIVVVASVGRGRSRGGGGGTAAVGPHFATNVTIWLLFGRVAGVFRRRRPLSAARLAGVEALRLLCLAACLLTRLPVGWPVGRSVADWLAGWFGRSCVIFFGY